MSTNDITGDRLVSKVGNEAYREGYDKIFKKPPKKKCKEEECCSCIEYQREYNEYLDSTPSLSE